MAKDMPKSAYLVNLSGTAELKLVEAVAAAMPSGQVRPSIHNNVSPSPVTASYVLVAP